MRRHSLPWALCLPALFHGALLQGCGGSAPEPPTSPTPAPAPRRPSYRIIPNEAPSAEALACTGFPFAPDDTVSRCAASATTDGVAVEEAWVRVPGRRKGRPMTPDDPDTWQVEWTLLFQSPTGWARYPLRRLFCGGEVPLGCSHAKMFGRMRPDDRWAAEQLIRPSCAPHLASPTETRTLDLPQACVCALARCGLEVDVPLAVSSYRRSERTNAVVLGVAPPLLLEPEFSPFGFVVADPAIFATDASCGPESGLRSRTAVV